MAIDPSIQGFDTGVASVSAALVDMFGDRAKSIAERQAAEATGDAAATWQAIVRSLTAMTVSGKSASPE